ncbi:MAG: FAD-binding oxidoreductase [Halieaceae bacterium]
MRSWGGLPDQAQQQRRVQWRDQLPGLLAEIGLVAGLGRSYGDVGLAANGVVLSSTGLDRVLAFDRELGVVRCEAGVNLGDLLQLCIPTGWMLPVVPGSQFVTVGGAIANDVHGKNHHVRGCFGRHVRGLLLQRTDGEELWCSPQQNQHWFNATVAGLGLTGCIVEAEIQLIPITGALLDIETIKFEGLEDFLALSAETGDGFEYSVAWIDCLSKRSRGHFTRANFSEQQLPVEPVAPLFSVPFAPPFSPVNALSLRLFNSAYYHRQRARRLASTANFYQWMFPLDRIGNWNRLYGRRGFRQYQCVVQAEAVADLLQIIRRAGTGSLLAVLKQFGAIKSPGLLSFPRPGVTLALDFPWRGEPTLELFRQLDAVVVSVGGAIYPAKDAHMGGVDFRRAYPSWEIMEQYCDPGLLSLFWQRVMEDA